MTAAAHMDDRALGLLMPMFLWLSDTGRILGAGPTLRKVLSDPNLIGGNFLDNFRLKRPHEAASPAALVAMPGQQIRIVAHAIPGRVLRGVAVPLVPGQGVLLNLSFGIAVADAVREHNLTNADFAPTDLAVELLYLLEAKAAVLDELRALNERLQGARDTAEAEAVTDILTGLGNRRAMERGLNSAMASGQPFALLHIDLDLFKKVNDTLGHAAGDQMLCEISRILRNNTREEDTVARVGGDEFLVILPGVTEPEKLRRLGARLLSATARPFHFDGRPCRVGLSIGAALSIHHPRLNGAKLLKEADRALYASKRRGRAQMTIAGIEERGEDLPPQIPVIRFSPLPR